MDSRWKVLIVFLFVTATGCAALTIDPVDYSWGIESVLPVDKDGSVAGVPKTLSFNAAPLYALEMGGVPQDGKRIIRVIRNRAGYYFVTAPAFKHVYVFRAGIGSLKLSRKILTDPEGMKRPAFNQRAPYIQLINGKKVLMLTENGVSGDTE